jgi:PAS domain S-box-containing protein
MKAQDPRLDEIERLKNQLAQAEQALAAARAELERRPQVDDSISPGIQRAILDHSPAAITLLDARGQVIYNNPASLRLGGYSQEERLSHHALDLVPAEDLPAAALVFQRLLATPGASEHLQLRTQARDGSTLWLDVDAVNLLHNPEIAAVVVYYQDITQRMLAERSLRESEQRFRDVLEHSIDAAYQRDLRRDTYDYISPAIERIAGYTPDEMCSMDLETTLDHIHPNDLPHIQQALPAALSSRQGEHRLEYRFRHKNGGYVWFQDRFTVLRDEQGQPRFLVGSVENISDRRQAETALRENQARLELTLDAAEMGTFSMEVDLQAPHIDARACRLLGLDPLTFSGSPQEIFSHFMPEDLERFYADRNQAMQMDNPQDSQYRVVWPDGQTHYIAMRGRLFYDENGRPLRVNGILWDITRRVDAELALQESEATLNSFFNSTQAMMGIVRILPEDQDMQYLRLNEAAIQYLGSRPEAIPGLRASQAGLSPANRRLWLEQCQVCLQSGAPVQFEYQRDFPDGPHWLLTTLNNIEPEVFSFAAADITALKEMQHELQQVNSVLEERVTRRTEELLRANDELEQALSLRDEFLANMSHELRTPLTAVLGLSEALQMQVYGEVTERQRRALANIHISGKRLQVLVDNLMEMSHLAAGKVDLHPGPVVVDRLMQSCLDQVRSSALKKDQELTTRRDPQLAYLMADEVRLRQILVGLLDNAIKFTPAGGEIGLEVEADPVSRQVRWIVWDTGIGIPQEQRDQLFEPFVQLDGGLTRQYGGTGLGLALVNRLVELHGGSICIESIPGQGSRFIITLPWQRLDE